MYCEGGWKKGSVSGGRWEVGGKNGFRGKLTYLGRTTSTFRGALRIVHCSHRLDVGLNLSGNGDGHSLGRKLNLAPAAAVGPVEVVPLDAGFGSRGSGEPDSRWREDKVVLILVLRNWLGTEELAPLVGAWQLAGRKRSGLAKGAVKCPELRCWNAVGQTDHVVAVFVRVSVFSRLASCDTCGDVGFATLNKGIGVVYRVAITRDNSCETHFC